MRILELFCGTKSFSKVANKSLHSTCTIDIDDKFEPNICIDILDFKIEMLENFKPDVVWASPPCTEYSKAKSRGIRKLEEADKIVLKTLEIIKQINPKIWIIENPQTGLLKTREFMQGLPFTDCSYCKYGKPYKKQTRFWNNINLKLDTCNKDCNSFVEGRHVGSCGCGGQGQGHKKSYSDKSYKLKEKYSIPEKLCEDILRQMEKLI